MKIESTPIENHQINLHVEFDTEQIETAKRRAARHISSHKTIPGFRPGKAPYPVVVRQVGEAAILEEAIELLVNDQYPEIIKAAGITPYGPGKLEKIISTDPPVFDFIVPLQAEVELGDYLNIREPYELKPIGEDEILSVLDELRDSHAILEPVDLPVNIGDVVTVKISGSREALDDAETSTSLVPEMSIPVQIREDNENENEWPFPGFSQQLIGLSKGETRVLTHIFSLDSAYESLRGVSATFNIEIEEVKVRNLPAIDDAFASQVGEFDNLESLRANIFQNLEEQARDEYHTEYDEKILEQLIEQSEFKYPPQMLEDEITGVIDNLSRRLEEQNQTLDLYLKSRSLSETEFREEVTPVAETRLKRSLVVSELTKVFNISVDQKELEAETLRTLNSYAQRTSPEEAQKLVEQRGSSNLVGNIMLNMIANKTMDKFRSIARGDALEPDTALDDPENPVTTETDNQ